MKTVSKQNPVPISKFSYWIGLGEKESVEVSNPARCRDVGRKDARYIDLMYAAN